MARYLTYTSPARGHLYPIVDTLLELRRRGHEVHVRTLSSEVDVLRSLGLCAAPIAPAIEASLLDDWRSTDPQEAIGGVLRTLGERSEHEVLDLQSAIDEVGPDLLLVDVTTAGAAAVAEASQLPWAQWSPYFQHVTAGPDAETVVTFAPFTLIPAGMEVLNAPRRAVGLDPVSQPDGAWRAPLLVYLTAEPFEISAEKLPGSFRMVGPGLWEPPAEAASWLDESDQPLVLVTTSSEFQADDALIRIALEALRSDDVRVIATTAAHEPGQFTAGKNATVERWLPHGQLVKRAACVVCHGGMGITQRALAAGVPVCVVPFGRDQFEVAGRVASSQAGTVVMPEQLGAPALAAAIKEALTMRAGARRVAAGFARAGGAAAAADSLESVSHERRAATGAPPMWRSLPVTSQGRS